ncbi:MAG: superoxide dismutase [Cu-Zn] SodC [Rhodospirillales bacterium]
MKRFGLSLCGALLAFAGTASAQEVTITMHLVNADGVGEQVGLVSAQDTARGLKVTPNLRGLSEGAHGFHVHQNPNCGPAKKGGKVVPGLGAGGHYDPKKAGKHEGPDGSGHLGDLGVLYVNEDGTATRSQFVLRLKVSDIIGRSLMIHAGGDNYSDDPAALGGGGARAACGVIR